MYLRQRLTSRVTDMPVLDLSKTIKNKNTCGYCRVEKFKTIGNSTNSFPNSNCKTYLELEL